MDEKELLYSKYAFISGLFEFKSEMNNLSIVLDNMEEYLKLNHIANHFLNINFSSVDNMLSNKLVHLSKSFNERNIDMVFFKDEEEGSYYSSNFFSGNVLRYYRYRIQKIEEKITQITESMRDFHIRYQELYSNHMFKSIIHFYRYGSIYAKDEKSQELLQQVDREYAEYLELVNEFYKNDIIKDYPDIVKYNLKAAFKQREEHALSLSDLVVIYQIDCDFCVAFGCEHLIDEITAIYKEHFIEKGADPELIKRDNSTYFTRRQEELFNPKDYMYMEYSKLASTLLSFQGDLVGKLIGDINDINLKSILEGLGLNKVEGLEGESVDPDKNKRSIR